MVRTKESTEKPLQAIVAVKVKVLPDTCADRIPLIVELMFATNPDSVTDSLHVKMKFEAKAQELKLTTRVSQATRFLGIVMESICLTGTTFAITQDEVAIELTISNLACPNDVPGTFDTKVKTLSDEL